MQAGFCGGVVGLAKLARLTVDRSNADDAPEPTLAHAVDKLAGYVEGAIEIDCDDGVPIVHVHLVQKRVAGDAGAVDQHLYRAVLGLDFLCHSGTGVEVRHVALDPVDFVPVLAHRGLPVFDPLAFGVDASGYYAITRSRERLADFGAYTTIAAGNQR